MNSRNKHIAFLHTSPVHVASFEQLARTADPGLKVEHFVAEDLLADARSKGTDDAELIERVHAALSHAASSGASLVVCTCSTIGSLAEHAPTNGKFATARIDRAMADRSVELGPDILIVAALESTLGPTKNLIEESAKAMKTRVLVRTLLVSDAWQYFERGDSDRYVAAIAKAVQAEWTAANARIADVVVLAQASMAPAALLLTDLGVEVLSSPEIGVQAAVDYLRSA